MPGGWLQGLLSGYVDRHRELEKENLAQAELAAEREGKIYQHLLTSPDPEIARMAATGVLQLGQPRKRKSGLKGWMGEMETSPIYPELAKYIGTPQYHEDPGDGGLQLPRQPSVPKTSGAIPQAPAPVGSAALPETQTTTPGAAPPATTMAAPPAPPFAQSPSFTPGETPEAPEMARFSGAAEVPAAEPAAPPPPPPPQAAPPRTGSWTTPRFPTTQDAAVLGEVQAWEQLYQRVGDPNWKEKAAAMVESKFGHTGVNPYQGVRGEYVDDTGQTVQTYAIFNKARGVYQLQDGRTATNFRPIDTTGVGQWFNLAAKQAGYHDGNDVPAADFARVQKIAEQLQFTTRQAGAEGTMAGKAAGTIDPKTASEFQVPLGTEGRDLTGQVIPTTEQRTRRMTAETLKGQLNEIRLLLKTTLPSEKELAGLAPNAANAIRQRLSGERRTQYAQLNAKIDNIVAALSRSIGENRGAQTEADAQRAYATIADAKGQLTDPLGGDTAESADARIVETLSYLDNILSVLPATPKPTRPATAAPQLGTPPPSPAVAQPGAITLDTPLPAALGSKIDPVTGEFIR